MKVLIEQKAWHNLSAHPKIQVNDIAGLIYSILQKFSNELDMGAVLTLDTKKVRVRILPL